MACPRCRLIVVSTCPVAGHTDGAVVPTPPNLEQVSWVRLWRLVLGPPLACPWSVGFGWRCGPWPAPAEFGSEQAFLRRAQGRRLLCRGAVHLCRSVSMSRCLSLAHCPPGCRNCLAQVAAGHTRFETLAKAPFHLQPLRSVVRRLWGVIPSWGSRAVACAVTIPSSLPDVQSKPGQRPLYPASTGRLRVQLPAVFWLAASVLRVKALRGAVSNALSSRSPGSALAGGGEQVALGLGVSSCVR